MAIVPEPIFYMSIKRNDGARRKLIQFFNNGEADAKVTIDELDKPDWVHIEGIRLNGTIEIPRRKSKDYVVNINTTHQFFPRAESCEELIKIRLSNEETIQIPVVLQEIVDSFPDYRGAFALDFGTTNTCFAFKNPFAAQTTGRSSFERATISDQLPTLIYFRDVSSAWNPDFVIGNEAKFEIKEKAANTYAYFMSIKRAIGTNKRKKFIVLDELSTRNPEGHRQMWDEEEIAAFIIRDIIKKAQKELGERVKKVVATFPTLFPQGRKAALKRTIERALSQLGTEVEEDTVTLRLDEATAAAFGHVYSHLLQEMRQFPEVMEKQNLLLSFDFGGGTVDIAQLFVRIERARTGKLKIITDTKGVSGDNNLGGDNVTLEIFSIIKRRIALAVAAEKGPGAAKKADAGAAGSNPWDAWGGGGGKAANPFAAPAASSGNDDMFGSDEGSDPWSAGGKDEKGAAAVEEDAGPPPLKNLDEGAVFDDAVRRINDERAVIERSIADASDLLTAMAAIEKEKGGRTPKDQLKLRVSELDKALDVVLPTAWARFENNELEKERVARRLFFELWHEAELLKLRIVNSSEQKGNVEGVLRDIASYNGVDPMVFNAIGVTGAEMNKHIRPRILRAVQKAHGLYKNAFERMDAALFDDEATRNIPLTVILAGNSSRLPVVREVFREVFGISDGQIVVDSDNMKGVVAAGACDEQALGKAFGKGGLIHLEANDFSERLPYAIGMYHADLEMLGFTGGFCPIFTRGSKDGAEVPLQEESFPLIHSEMDTLPLYADYRDAEGPRPLGMLQLLEPEGNIWDEEPNIPHQLQMLAMKDKAEVAPEGSPYTLQMVLLEDRNVAAVHLQSGNWFRMRHTETAPDPALDPFSGVH